MTATIHKLTAGSGYDYLTRQVAAMDATSGQGAGHRGLASYYSERGEIPGRWLGSGMAGITGLDVGDTVTADQMLALYGLGRHPLAVERMDALEGPSLRPEDYRAVSELGTPFKVYDRDVTAFQIEVAKRIQSWNTDRGLPRDAPVPVGERAAIRTQVAREFFVDEHGRKPANERELAASVAKHTRPTTTAVAGYDLTFSPVKSVSSLWALAPQEVAARIEQAHQGAIDDALTFIEQHALFTRLGTGGVRQVEVQGLVAAAFTHRDSRAGDPDLHTHVAVANKVQTADGRWLAIDGRLLFKATVAMSETYNTALEKRLNADLGLVFAERDDGDPRKRPVREIVGVDPSLNARWSSRRAAIETRQAALSADFQRQHGRPPSPVEAFQLAQQATLETRDAKHAPRTLAEQRTAWAEQATQVLGGPDGVQAMVDAALSAGQSQPPVTADSAWFADTARQIVTNLQQRRATWQVWHVRAEAQRQIRTTGVPLESVEAAVDLLTGMVLDDLSVRIHDPGAARPDQPNPARPQDRPAPRRDLSEPVEPAPLRRRDGSSQYAVAGAARYTSTAVLDAEQRIVAAAGRHDGRRINAAAVDAALAESAAAGIRLNSGQAGLVERMGCSGARVQLAVAPAGSGKTTAMTALTRTWASSGGTVIGLAPSAAAAAVLRDQIGAQTDTLAMLTTALDRGVMPGWAAQIGPKTLVIIDEAGMADTLSLDAAIGYVVRQGGSVRLVGDDQQLSAVGAGGVLRDIANTHGAIHLEELMRFADPTEAAATLALREGRPEALGFYLDRGRVHIGDQAVSVERVFSAWQGDLDAGLDSIMLAPTRELAAELNARARAHRLQSHPETSTRASGLTSKATRARRRGAGAGSTGRRGHAGILRRGPAATTRAGAPAERTVVLADGNQAGVGDVIITRENRRRLRVSATDWVKNGDRWTIAEVRADGSLTAVGTRHGLRVHLPAEYTATQTHLGYATTIHAAQGLSTDTMHGLADGTETRQQLYTMMTRGARGNDLYLQVVGDGEAHTLTHPDTVHPLTATDYLQRILANDGAPTSATSTAREAEEPAPRLTAAAARYTDSLYVAAEELLGPETVAALETSAERVVPGIASQPAWPALRAHLILLGACESDPIEALRRAADSRELGTARDPAAVLDWRLDSTGLRNAGAGPLPWLPGIPPALRDHPTWSPYLARRAELTRNLADVVAAQTRADVDAGNLPAWVGRTRHTPRTSLIVDVQLWRAGTGVSNADLRPTGPEQLAKAPLEYQQRLDRALGTQDSPAMREWGHLLGAIGLTGDSFTPILAEQLATISRAGIDAATLVKSCAAERPLPDDHPSAALWWRMHRHLPAAAGPATLTQRGPHDPGATPSWIEEFRAHVGHDNATTYRASPWWPALVAVIDESQRRGWHLPQFLGPDAGAPEHSRDTDPCAVLVWRLSVLLDPIPEPATTSEPERVVDEVLDADPWAWTHHVPLPEPPPDPSEEATLPPDPAAPTPGPDTPDIEPGLDNDPGTGNGSGRGVNEGEPDLAPAALLTLAAQRRWYADEPEPTPAQTEAMIRRDLDWLDCPVTRDRLLEVNEAAAAFFHATYRGQDPTNQQRSPGTWARAYLRDRFRIDLAEHPSLDTAIRPGQAPAGWDTLVNHLRRLGFTDEELLTAGVATTASTGRLIDRFRDRVVFPIIHTPPADPEFRADPRPEILGFVGRRNPAHDPAPGQSDDRRHGPKYLNTPDTPLFHKGAQLYVAGHAHRQAAPVLVEGPMDAIAVTIAGLTDTLATSTARNSNGDAVGRYVGVAPLGTSLTDEQAAQLAQLHRDQAPPPGTSGPGTTSSNSGGAATAATGTADPRSHPNRQPIVATDADIPGRIAAERDYWLLTPWRLDPNHAQLPDRADPASLLADHGPNRLAETLDHAEPLADTLTSERLTNLPTEQALEDAATIGAARPPETWQPTITTLTNRLAISTQHAEHALQAAVTRWDANPQRVAERAASHAGDLKDRLNTAGQTSPAYADLAAAIDPRLPAEPDWAALNHLIHAAHGQGHDIPALLHDLASQGPLGPNPARELRYRLLINQPDLLGPAPPPTSPTRHGRPEGHPRTITPEQPIRPGPTW